MKTLILRLTKLVVMGAALILMLTVPCAAQEMGGVPSSIRTPEEVVGWFRSNFEYRLSMPDRPKTPAETIADKCGDCDDFAKLAAMILARSGIRSDVIIIKYKGLNIMHAVCIYLDKNGTYNFISSRELTRTRERSVQAAIAKYYPDYETITYVNS